jgi:hypothetical protein
MRAAHCIWRPFRIEDDFDALSDFIRRNWYFDPCPVFHGKLLKPSEYRTGRIPAILGVTGISLATLHVVADYSAS